MTARCRYCRGSALTRVLDLGSVPAADHFPDMAAPLGTDDATYPLAMLLCDTCKLAQLEADDTQTEEPRAVEPQALRDQAADAVARVGAAGLLTGHTVYEFGSPHGGSWLDLMVPHGFHAVDDAADVVLDSFGMMHDADQSAAVRLRAQQTKPDGVLLLQFHSVATITRLGQWNSLRHGHFAYYSLTALRRMLADAGMSIGAAWQFELYGGTVLIAAQHGDHTAPASVLSLLEAERRAGIDTAAGFASLQHAVDDQVRGLVSWLEGKSDAGKRVYGYGAPSRAVALFAHAGLRRNLLSAVADASPAKQGHRMPGTDIPIVSPEDLIAAHPDQVLLTLPDLHDEVSRRYPELEGRWVTGLC